MQYCLYTSVRSCELFCHVSHTLSVKYGPLRAVHQNKTTVLLLLLIFGDDGPGWGWCHLTSKAQKSETKVMVRRGGSLPARKYWLITPLAVGFCDDYRCLCTGVDDCLPEAAVHHESINVTVCVCACWPTQVCGTGMSQTNGKKKRCIWNVEAGRRWIAAQRRNTHRNFRTIARAQISCAYKAPVIHMKMCRTPIIK